MLSWLGVGTTQSTLHLLMVDTVNGSYSVFDWGFITGSRLRVVQEVRLDPCEISFRLVNMDSIIA